MDVNRRRGRFVPANTDEEMQMKLADVAKRAFAMPLTDPAYPPATNSTTANSW